MFSEKARALIIEFEGCDSGVNYPGLQSGPTFGFGYDIGQRDVATFTGDWKALLPPEDFAVLLTGVGLRGDAAAAFCERPEVQRITIPKEASVKVLDSRDIPAYTALTQKAFSGFDALPLDAQGALVSLVFNRGASVKGASRAEMKKIRDILAAGFNGGTLTAIAEQLRAMKRLWEGKKMGGLIRRREEEAALVESCIA